MTTDLPSSAALGLSSTIAPTSPPAAIPPPSTGESCRCARCRHFLPAHLHKCQICGAVRRDSDVQPVVALANPRSRKSPASAHASVPSVDPGLWDDERQARHPVAGTDSGRPFAMWLMAMNVLVVGVWSWGVMIFGSPYRYHTTAFRFFVGGLIAFAVARGLWTMRKWVIPALLWVLGFDLAVILASGIGSAYDRSLLPTLFGYWLLAAVYWLSVPLAYRRRLW